MNAPAPDHALALRALDARPSWRGWIHAGTFPLAIVLGGILIVAADGTAATTGAAIFAVASLLLFGISALYHRLARGPRLTATLRRFDHANIFLLIAGTYTPISVLCLPQEQWVPLLALVWSGAAVGIGFRLLWMRAPRWLYVPIYLALGWAAVGYAGDLFAASRLPMTLVLAGGILYSLGAVVYALKRPNPIPRVFGFHEVFHALTVLAFLCHWAAVALVATSPPAL
jgi:hemolysin III